ncbi:MAG: D-alanyl-D-alanine carboxypeptidase [Clostridia bacterium]|nr:D-alanyl-D-alanine carboxypeptidase [Clostridia bacterium]
MMKKLLFFVLIAAFLAGSGAEAAPVSVPENAARAYILVDGGTGEALAERRAHDRFAPASVTKIMTMLLVAEALDAGQYAREDPVTASERAAGMGGSQIWLKPGEVFTVEELLKTVAVVSANDAAVALAEFTAGSEESFVERMNDKAVYLGMLDTHFENCTGLPAEGHLTSAYDVALMSRALLEHKWITSFTSIGTDTIRDGKMELVNTNKLIRTYDGATGLKTGFTQEARYCLSASAEREGTSLIAVVLGGDTSALRFEAAASLLNYGFANYRTVDLLENAGEAPESLPVINGKEDAVSIGVEGGARVLLPRAKLAGLRYELDLPEKLPAPVEKGQSVGKLSVWSGEELLLEKDFTALEPVEAEGFFDVFRGLLRRVFLESAA